MLDGSNAQHLNIELAASRSVTISVYFTNATAFASCIKSCTLKVPTAHEMIIRIDTFLLHGQRPNYTLDMACWPYSTTVPPNVQDESYDQYFSSQLTTRRSRGNIISFNTSVLILIGFITIGSFVHRGSTVLSLKFLSKKSNLPFYASSIITLVICLQMVSTWQLDQGWLGLLIVGTMTSVNFVSVIGMKHDGSYYRNVRVLQYEMTLSMLCRYLTLMLGVLYGAFYFSSLAIGGSLLTTVFAVTFVELAVLSLASFVSKTAQVCL